MKQKSTGNIDWFGMVQIKLETEAALDKKYWQLKILSEFLPKLSYVSSNVHVRKLGKSWICLQTFFASFIVQAYVFFKDMQVVNECVRFTYFKWR